MDSRSDFHSLEHFIGHCLCEQVIMSGPDDFAESLFKAQSRNSKPSVEKRKSDDGLLQVIHGCFFILL